MATALEALPVREIRFGAMGSDAHVIVVGGSPDLPAAARARIEQLESRWSRFRPDSELCRLNDAAGRPVRLSADTFAAVTAAVEAWRATGGRFDPTVLHAMVAIGYDRDFASVAPEAPDVAEPIDHATPGCAAIEIDPIVGAITLPLGTALDLGGIGKGLAADVVVTELLEAGASGACVNIGGDLRVRGAAPTAAGWVVDVAHLPDLRIALADGAVATSSTAKRRWTRGDATRHHLVDPRRSLPTETGLAAVTVIAGTGATAEMLTKAAFVAGAPAAAEVVGAGGATGVIVTTAGEVRLLAGVEEYLR